MHVHPESPGPGGGVPGAPGDDVPAAFNDLPVEACEAALLECLHVARWAHTVAAGRPYPTATAALAAASAAGADLTDEEVDSALARHPRIGERPAPGSPGRAAGWSRSEQGGVDSSNAVLALALRAGNEEYERKFGRVFLIRAAGRSGDEILTALNERLLHDYTQELAIVRRELTGIALLRLEKVLAGG
jgi:2-oxo-4-hydroxy-4-carboxy-5-ureidoimidazoline decarboxylase